TDQAPAAATSEEARPFIARSSSGHVRGVVAPPGRAWAASGGDPTPEGRALAFLSDNRLALGWSKDAATLHATSVRADRGRSFVRFEQRASGVRIFGADARVQVERGGAVAFVLAHLARDGANAFEPGFSTTPRVEAAEAQDAARAVVADRRAADLAAEPPELLVYEPSLIGNEGYSQLVWYVRVRSVSEPVNEVVLVDAATGAVAFHYSDIKEAKNRSIFDSADVAGSNGTLVRSEGQPAS